MERTASAVWHGGIKDGKGIISTQSSVLKESQYSFSTRFENGIGTNPEELIAAAHAGCFTMALSAQLSGAGRKPTRLHTKATVSFTKAAAGWTIDRIDLATEGSVPGISAEDFLAKAEEAKKNCPVSRALTGVDIHLAATLL